VDTLGLDARCLDTAGRVGRTGNAVGQDEDDVRAGGVALWKGLLRT